eukprot:g16833.t1
MPFSSDGFSVKAPWCWISFLLQSCTRCLAQAVPKTTWAAHKSRSSAKSPRKLPTALRRCRKLRRVDFCRKTDISIVDVVLSAKVCTWN